MVKISVCKLFGLELPDNYKEFLDESFEKSFHVSLPDKLKAKVKLDFKKKQGDTRIDKIEVSDDLFNSLTKGSKFSKDNWTEIDKIALWTLGASQKILDLIKYHLNYIELPEKSSKSVGGYFWKTGREKWKSFPNRQDLVSSSYSLLKLDADLAVEIQSTLNNKIEPLIAMRHLHRAINERDTRYKWIDATIAAELAVKEVLSRKTPKIRKLLEELPSPPLEKLYGPILEEYLGEKSPYVSKLRDGGIYRNKLIHRPFTESPKEKDTIIYVHNVQCAIFHLLVKLYPEDQLVKSMYDALTKDKRKITHIQAVSNVNLK